MVDNGCSAVAGDILSLSFGLNEDVFETELTAVLDGFNMDFNYSDEIFNYWIVNKAFADTYGINTDFCNHILFSVEEMNSRNVSAIKEQYLTGNGSFVNFQSDKENDEKQLKGMMILALYLIVATALAGFVSMANTIKFNILTRRRENAIMRAIGLPFEIQVKTICMENLLLILAAVLVSTVLSFGLNTLITSKIIYDFQVHIFPYIFTLISAVIVSEVIAYVTVKKYGKNNLSDEIRSNE